MSTAAKVLSSGSTVNIELGNEDNTYRYGDSGTDPLSIESVLEPIIKPRSPRVIEVTKNHNDKKEDIKQIWNGIVLSCNDQELTVRLEDLIHPSNPDEIVELSMEEIDIRDQPLVKIGAMFFWHIGYRFGPKYPRERFSKISFRRLPKWTDAEILTAKKQAKEYADFFLTNSTQTT